MKKTEKLKQTIFKNERKDADLNAKRYDSRWTTFSRLYRKNNPWCVECMKEGNWNDAKIQVDHIIPLEIAPERRYDKTNLQSLCISHHSAKTNKEKLSKEATRQQIENLKQKLNYKRSNRYTQKIDEEKGGN